MKIRIEFEMDGAAFQGPIERVSEIYNVFEHILGNLADSLDRAKIMDSNGNTIGKWEITEKE